MLRAQSVRYHAYQRLTGSHFTSVKQAWRVSVMLLTHVRLRPHAESQRNKRNHLISFDINIIFDFFAKKQAIKVIKAHTHTTQKQHTQKEREHRQQQSSRESTHTAAERAQHTQRVGESTQQQSRAAAAEQ